SRNVRTSFGCPNGGVPPTANPVAALASSGSARRASDVPARVARRPTSTRLAPLVSARTGSPSATNTSDFTICPTSHPIARAASGAVFVPSGNRRTSTGCPSTVAASRNRSIALLMRQRYRPHGGGYDTPAARPRAHDDAPRPRRERTDDDGPHPAARDRPRRTRT